MEYKIEKHAGGESNTVYTGNGDLEKICSKLALLMHHAMQVGNNPATFYVYEDDEVLAEATIMARCKQE